MKEREKPLYMISAAAKMAGMHPQTLRVYESRGLVSPKRSVGNTRLYSQADIERLELIAKLTNEGINLTGVTRILDLQTRLEQSDEDLKKQATRVKQLQERLRDLLRKPEITALVRLRPRAIRRWQSSPALDYRHFPRFKE